jgi:TRAP-type C4-dicarboxylate transport system permease small subunit
VPETSTRPLNADPSRQTRDPLIDLVDRTVRNVALWGGGTMLLGLMGLTVVDVTLRYLFNAPLYGARDVGKLMLLALVALSVAYSARTGGQVVIEFFSHWMGPRLAAFSEAGARLAAILMLTILSWQLWLCGDSAAIFGEASMALGIPFGPFYSLLASGMLLYAVVLAAELLLILRGRVGDLGLPTE